MDKATFNHSYCLQTLPDAAAGAAVAHLTALHQHASHICLGANWPQYIKTLTPCEAPPTADRQLQKQQNWASGWALPYDMYVFSLKNVLNMKHNKTKHVGR